MDVKDLQKEQILLSTLYERNAMLLDLNNQVLQLQEEVKKYKQTANDLEKKENLA